MEDRSKMKSIKEVLIFLTLLSVVSAKQKNVLFFVVDDLRPEMNAYNGPDEPAPIHPRMVTPNLDELASRSLLLKRAFVQQAVCSPSRTSTLTGRRPDTTHVYDLFHYFRHVGGNFTTIPQFFKEHDYEVAGMGKVFHPGHTSGNDDPISWTRPYFHAGNDKWSKYEHLSWYGVNDTELPNHPLQDMSIAKKAVDTLKELAPNALSGEKNFFIAVGFHRPHLPWLIPQSFLDLYPLNEIRLPENPYAPIDMPELAWSDFSDLRGYTDMRPYSRMTHGSINTTFPDDVVRKLRRGYYASVSYTDSLIGKVMKALKDLDLDDSTVVSFWGDHGWNLGEHGEWCKHNNFETSTHAPMMVRVPGLTDHGVVTEALTEFVDLFPTLTEATGLGSIPLCPKDSSKIELCTEGISMMPLIEDPKREWKKAVFSQYPRLDLGGGYRMAYSMRTNRYRYSEIPLFEESTFSPYWSMASSVDLYDHEIDPMENWNRRNLPEYRNVSMELKKQIHSGWRAALPPGY